jgi:hypothetical protein
MDATYFKQFCVVCYQDDEDGYTQLIRITDGEHYVEIKEDLDNLIKLGVHIESITTDGHKSALKAIKKIPSRLTKNIRKLLDIVKNHLDLHRPRISLQSSDKLIKWVIIFCLTTKMSVLAMKVTKKR